jgi:hypothetical protein
MNPPDEIPSGAYGHQQFGSYIKAGLFTIVNDIFLVF